MSRRNQRALPPKHEPQDDDAIDGIPEIPESSNLITSQTIQILVKEDKVGDIEKLLNAEVEYNRKRFEVLREHAEKHPDAIESRKTNQFRRHQYVALIVFLGGILVTLAYVPLSAAAVFGVLATLIVCGIIINGREREFDLAGLVKVISNITRREK